MSVSALPIDVIIPVYNGEKYVEQALGSVNQQSRPPRRIIIVNDGSTDNTAQLIKDFKSKIPVISIKQKNSGLGAARNAGIRRSSSPYLAFLDVDDYWEKTKLEKQWQIFEHSNLSRLGVVYCDTYLIDSQGNKLGDDYFKLNPTYRGDIYNILLETNVVTGSGSGVLVKKECFDRVGLFDEVFSNNADWDMWLKLAEHFEYDFVPEQLVAIRRHAENMSADTKEMLLGQIWVLSKHADALLSHPPRFRSHWTAVYSSLTLMLIHDIFSRRFTKRVWQTMSPGLKKHFWRQFPFVLLELLIKSPLVFTRRMRV